MKEIGALLVELRDAEIDAVNQWQSPAHELRITVSLSTMQLELIRAALEWAQQWEPRRKNG